MSKQIQEAYIVAATRPPVAKKGGMFRNVRPDDMLAHAIKSVVAQVPGIDPARIGDVIVGCAMPEAEQGMNVARIGSCWPACRSPCRASPSTASARPACRPWPMRPTRSASAWPT